MKIYFNKRIKFFFMVLFLFSFLFIFQHSVTASVTEIYFQSTTKEIKVGGTFSVSLNISSPDKMVNVIDGTITYDKDKLVIEKIKTNGSLLSLWTKEPIFNNETGELSFVGGVPNGFKGQNGQILEITFLAKEEGSTVVGFKDIFSVFINDGLGTKINPWLKPMSISVDKKLKSSLVKNLWQKQSDKTWPLVLVVLFIFIVIIVSRYKSKNNRNAK